MLFLSCQHNLGKLQNPLACYGNPIESVWLKLAMELVELLICYSVVCEAHLILHVLLLVFIFRVSTNSKTEVGVLFYIRMFVTCDNV